MSTDLRTDSFIAFLNGTHIRDNSNIKFLPIDVLEIIWDNYVLDNFTLEEIIKFKFNKILFKNIDKYISKLDLIIDSCCIYANLDAIKLLLQDSTIKIQPKSVSYAAIYGHLHVIKWLHINKPDIKFNSSVMDYAAMNGQLHVVEWLHFNRPEFGPNGMGCTEFAMNVAAIYGHLHVVKWLHEHRKEGCNESAMDYAAERGNLNMIKWLHENRAMNLAARNGHLELVKWLYEHRTEGCIKSAMYYAADRGHLEIFNFLKNKL